MPATQREIDAFRNSLNNSDLDYQDQEKAAWNFMQQKLVSPEFEALPREQKQQAWINFRTDLISEPGLLRRAGEAIRNLGFFSDEPKFPPKKSDIYVGGIAQAVQRYGDKPATPAPPPKREIFIESADDSSRYIDYESMSAIDKWMITPSQNYGAREFKKFGKSSLQAGAGIVGAVRWLDDIVTDAAGEKFKSNSLAELSRKLSDSASKIKISENENAPLLAKLKDEPVHTVLEEIVGFLPTVLVAETTGPVGVGAMYGGEAYNRMLADPRASIMLDTEKKAKMLAPAIGILTGTLLSSPAGKTLALEFGESRANAILAFALIESVSLGSKMTAISVANRTADALALLPKEKRIEYLTNPEALSQYLRDFFQGAATGFVIGGVEGAKLPYSQKQGLLPSQPVEAGAVMPVEPTEPPPEAPIGPRLIPTTETQNISEGMPLTTARIPAERGLPGPPGEKPTILAESKQPLMSYYRQIPSGLVGEGVFTDEAATRTPVEPRVITPVPIDQGTPGDALQRQREAEARQGGLFEQPSEPEPARQPWEMTRDEYINRAVQGIKEKAVSVGSKTGKKVINRSLMSRVESEEFRQAVKAQHRSKVQAALAEGKQVPNEVLADYPELQKASVQTEVAFPGIGPQRNIPSGTILGGVDEIASLHDDVKYNRIPGNEKRSIWYKEEDRNLAGINTKGFRHAIDSFSIRKIYKDHGSIESEAPRGQIPITLEDFLKIPEIIESPDAIDYVGEDSPGRKLLRFKKRFINGTIFYVEEVRTKRYELMLKTMWKARTTSTMPSDSKAEVPAPTSETFGRKLPQVDSSITTAGEKSKDIIEVKPPDEGKAKTNNLLNKLTHGDAIKTELGKAATGRDILSRHSGLQDLTENAAMVDRLKDREELGRVVGAIYKRRPAPFRFASDGTRKPKRYVDAADEAARIAVEIRRSESLDPDQKVHREGIPLSSVQDARWAIYELRKEGGLQNEDTARLIEFALEIFEGKHPKLTKYVNRIEAEMQQLGQDAMDPGLISSVLAHYSPRYWIDPKGKRGKSYRARFATKSKYAQQRVFNSYFEGLRLGYRPRVRGLSNVKAELIKEYGNTLADRELISIARTMKDAEGRPFFSIDSHGGDYKELHHPNFYDYVPIFSINLKPFKEAISYAGQEAPYQRGIPKGLDYVESVNKPLHDQLVKLLADKDIGAKNTFITQHGDRVTVLEKRKLYAPRLWADHINAML